MLIKATLSNARHPEYGEVTIPFPIKTSEYDHKQIHWKATARRDHIVVKEIIANHIPRIIVIVDLCGSPSQMDRLLDRVLGTSFQLVSMGYPHEIIRSDHADEASPIIYSKDDALQMMRNSLHFPELRIQIMNRNDTQILVP